MPSISNDNKNLLVHFTSSSPRGTVKRGEEGHGGEEGQNTGKCFDAKFYKPKGSCQSYFPINL